MQLNTLELEGVLIEGDELHTTRQFLNKDWTREPACQTVESNQKKFYRHFRWIQVKRHISVSTIDHNKHHGHYQHWKLKAKEPPQHIKANWEEPGSSGWSSPPSAERSTGRCGTDPAKQRPPCAATPASAPPQTPCGAITATTLKRWQDLLCTATGSSESPFLPRSRQKIARTGSEPGFRGCFNNAVDHAMMR